MELVVTAGTILRDSYLSLEHTPEVVAEACGVDTADIEALLSGKGRVTPKIDVGLCQLLGTSDNFWLGLQHDDDLEQAARLRRDIVAA